MPGVTQKDLTGKHKTCVLICCVLCQHGISFVCCEEREKEWEEARADRPCVVAGFLIFLFIVCLCWW